MSYARLRDTASTSPSKDTENLVPLHGPTPLEVKGRGIFDPKPNLCFSCNPVYTHDRNWIRPECPPQERNLILCFDGTGDSFDEDVSQLSRLGSRSQLMRHFQNSNVVQLLAMMKKDEPEKQLVYYQVISLGLLVKSTILTWPSTGRYRYLHEPFAQVADYRGHVQISGHDVCLRAP